MTSALSRMALRGTAVAALVICGQAHASVIDGAAGGVPAAAAQGASSGPVAAAEASRPATNLRITATSISVAGFDAPRASHKRR